MPDVTKRDLVGALINALHSEFGVPVVGQAPDTDAGFKAPLLVVERAGGVMRAKGVQDRPIIEVSVWGVSKKKTYDQARQVLVWLLSLPPRFDGFMIQKIEDVSGLDYAPATGARAYRYRLNVAITVRKTA